MYLKNMSWLALEKIIKLFSMFLTSIVISRALGASDFGLYNFIISITLIINPLIMFGFDEYCFQKFVTSKSIRFNEKLINTCVSLRIIFALIVLILIIALSLTTKVEYMPLLVIAVSHFSFSALSIFQIYNNAKLKSDVNARVNLLLMVTMVIIRCLFYYFDFDLTAFLIIYAIELSLSGVLLLKTYPNRLRLKIDFLFIMKLSKKLIPLAVSSLAVVVYYKIDQMMLGIMVNFESVGIYAVQAQIVLAINLILQILINGTYPAWFVNGELKQKILIGTYKLAVWFSLFSIFFAYFYSEIIISFVWGEEYSSASDILIITLFGTLFSGLGYISSKKMIYIKLQYFRMKRVVVGMVINIMLNYFLIPKYGVHGAALATVVSHLYSGLLGNLFSKVTRNIFLEQVLSFKIYEFDEIIVLYKKVRYGRNY
ncbi:membrane hypothetical protein [Vibrio chagasii]|nr:membrane hypothetical protein [Vibrio chagasii]CAH7415643.1 membrane hypothetical protein [Vibrio chagasii]CAH7424394.1 membrane hypothetical protein [Vibrio chagasii]